MTPRADEYEEDELSDSEIDEGLKEDIDAITLACGRDPDDFRNPTADSAAATSDGYSAGAHSDEDLDNLELDRDPLLGAGDAVIAMTDSDDDQQDLEYLKRVQNLYQPSSLDPLSSLPSLPAVSDDEEDDLETLRAILNRFSSYDKGHEGSVDKLAEGAHASSLCIEGGSSNSVISNRSDATELYSDSLDASKTSIFLTENNEMQPCGFIKSYKQDACEPSKLPDKRAIFPVSARVLFDAIKKNRSFQEFLRSKLIQIEAKIEENKKLKDKVKLLKDFQVTCIRRTGHALSQKKDPRVQLISAKKSSASNSSKINGKKVSAMYYGPAENSHVCNYRMVLERFPLSLNRKKWSNVDRENLAKGIRQQFLEMVLQISFDRASSEGDANDCDSMVASIKDLEITAENIREFLPKVNWDRLASTHVVGHTGAECEARWLNCEDPLINHSPWTSGEDKFLLHIVQEMGIRNWFDIAVSLATNRTPFQCLARYQRGLNTSMLNSEWTEEEDAQLCHAVATFGESNWQSVASVLERRVGTQCSNRWKKSLCPERKGSFTQEEDERLTVAVLLFGRKWNQIANFVPGRTQAQCRDRYVNSLDPSLKWGGWTKEEDSRLKAAISKHGYCWSKVAEDVPPRTDSQCRKRWKVLCPDQVPLLQEARKMKNAALISNFVDRESERPALTLNDFLPLAMIGPPCDPDAGNFPRKRKTNSSSVPKRPKKCAKKAKLCPKEIQEVSSNEDETCGRPDVHLEKITTPHLEECNSFQAEHDNSILPSDSVLMTTNEQGDLGGCDTRKKLLDLNPVWNGCNGSDLNNQSCIITPCENLESGRTNCDYVKDNGGNCTIDRGRSRKHYQGRKRCAKDSLERHRSQESSGQLMLSPSVTDGEAVGSHFARGTVSRKASKSRGNQVRKNKGAEQSEHKLDKIIMSKHENLSPVQNEQDLENQEEDNITLACFLHNRSKKREFKYNQNVTWASFPSTISGSESLLSKPHVPSAVRNELLQTCDAGGTSHLSPGSPWPYDARNLQTNVVKEQNVAPHGLVKIPNDVLMLTDHDEDNLTLACLLSRSKKLSNGSMFPKEVHKCHQGKQKLSVMEGMESDRGCDDEINGNLLAHNLQSSYLKNTSTVTADGTEPAMSESKKREFKYNQNVTQASFPSTISGSESLLSKPHAPSAVQNELLQTCGAGGTSCLSPGNPQPDDARNMQIKVTTNEFGMDVVEEQNVAPRGLVKRPKDVIMLTGHDEDNLTLACLLSRSKKLNRAAKGTRACTSSSLKNGSMFPKEVHKYHQGKQKLSVMEGMESDRGCDDEINGNLLAHNLQSSYLKNTSTVTADGPAMSESVEEQTTVLNEGVTEPTNINVEEENEATDVSFLQNKTRRQPRAPKCGIRPSRAVPK